MRRRPQPYDLWTQSDGAVVLVTRCVVEADQNRHADIATLLNFSDASSRPPQDRHEPPPLMIIRSTKQPVRSNPGRPQPVSDQPRRHAAPPGSGLSPAPSWREYNRG